MHCRLLPWPVGAFVLLGVAAARADDPPALDKLPAPRAAETFVVPPPMLHGPDYPINRVNRYEVWQYRSVDRFNQWRPRVAISPYGGAYYLYDGAPYYYMPLNSRNFSTTIMGTPYR